MAEMLSPLQTKCVAGRFGASGDVGVTLGTRPIMDLWQIANWDLLASSASPALNALGLDGPGDYRCAQQAGPVTSWRIAPDKILLEGAGDMTAHASVDLMVLDLSHAKVAVTLQGARARDVLSQLIAIDTAPGAFKRGDFVQTGIHHVGVLIHCTGDDTFSILIPASWSETVWEVLFDNALPHGLSVVEAA
ncbi:MAG: sarcosine oxidase subunit gamma family protein [Roseovarius sp.]